MKNASCNNLGSAVCYAYPPLSTPPSNDYDLARYDPIRAPITYTVLPNGVQQTHVDGDYCGDSVNIPRTVSIAYVCDATATTPVVTSYNSTNCVYNITVATSVTCGTPFSTPTGGVSSTGSAGGTSSTSRGSTAVSGATTNPSTTGTSVSSTGGGVSSGGNSNDSGGGGGSSLSGGAIAGIVIGSVAGLILLLLLLWCFVCGGLLAARGKKSGDGFSDVDQQRRQREPSHVAEESNVEMSHVNETGEEEATA